MTHRLHSIRLHNTNCYMLVGEGGVVLVDPGPPHRENDIQEELRSFGCTEEDVKLIFVTHGHYDHFGSAEAMRERTGALIAAHPLDAQWMSSGRHHIPPAQDFRSTLLRWWFIVLSPLVHFHPCVPDLLLKDEERLDAYGVAARVLFTPGHTLGSISLVTDDGIALIGDTLVNRTLLTEPTFADDRIALQQSLKRLRSMAPTMLYPGHGDPLTLAEMDHVLPGHYQMGWWVP